MRIIKELQLCYRAKLIGEVMRENLQETLCLLDEDKDWQKVHRILSNLATEKK